MFFCLLFLSLAQREWRNNYGDYLSQLKIFQEKDPDTGVGGGNKQLTIDCKSSLENQMARLTPQK